MFSLLCVSVMWSRFPRCDSDSRVGLPVSSHHHDCPHPHKAGGLRRGSAPNGGNKVASWQGPGSANQEEDRRTSADHRRVPPCCPPSSAPTQLEALDFHGKTPPVYPHWCSLCDVTVMSEKVNHKGRSLGDLCVGGCFFLPDMCVCVRAGLAPAHQWDSSC